MMNEKKNVAKQHPVRIGRTLVHSGSILRIYSDTMQLPDGSTEEFDFIRHNGAAAVIPLLDDGRVLMVKQHRNAVDQFTLEIPAGGLESIDEPTHDCAFRELEEETGYYAKKEDVTFLMSMYTTVAFCNEKIDIYVARNLTRTEQHLDDDEYIEVYAYSFEELKDMILEGRIVDGKTIAGLMTLYNVMLTK